VSEPTGLLPAREVLRLAAPAPPVLAAEPLYLLVHRVGSLPGSNRQLSMCRSSTICPDTSSMSALVDDRPAPTVAAVLSAPSR
jgi:hypothetical protein